MAQGDLIRVVSDEGKEICDAVIMAQDKKGILIAGFFPLNADVSSFSDVSNLRHIVLKVGDLGLISGNWRTLPQKVDRDGIPEQTHFYRETMFGANYIDTYDCNAQFLEERRVENNSGGLSSSRMHGYVSAEVVLAEFFGVNM